MKSAQQEWHDKTLEYAKSVNAFLARALQLGWERAGAEPSDPGRGHLVEAALEAVRQANANGELTGLRESWPPAYAPLVPLLEHRAQSIPVAYLLDDGSIIARIGAAFESGRTVRIFGESCVDVPHVGFLGRSPDRRYFAIAGVDGVRILAGWGGPRVALCPWPTGRENLPAQFDALVRQPPPLPTRLIPFPDGKRVLFVSNYGIFVLSPEGATRLLPTLDQLLEDLQIDAAEDLLEDGLFRIDMEHAAISKDGSLIALGSQDSTHLILDANLELVGDIGQKSSYPHYALFSDDTDVIALNSCHFYDGATIGVNTSLLGNLHTAPNEDDERTPLLEDGARVYAGVGRGDEFIVGDAYGYVRAFSKTGEYRWQHFIGSTLECIDISPDEKTLLVTSQAGFLSVIQLDAGKQAPYQIGNGNHWETRRWLFWKNEPRPLIW